MIVRPEPDSTGNSVPLHYVIGSGPSGVACAHALLQRGAKVVLLDAGVSLEKSRADLVAQMCTVPPASWSSGQIRKLKEGMVAGAKGIPLKLAFGSDYPYREYDQHFPADYENVALRPTLARGGFSSVWGAAMMPYSEQDVAGWPVRSSDLTGHYAAVAKFTGLSAKRDDLEKLFPIYLDQPAALNLSSQAKIFLGKLEKNRRPLREAGIVFGQARVGVRVAQSPQSPGCVYCGLCMYGCPYGYIYNSEDTLRELQKNPNFTYQPDVVVMRLRETTGSVVIEGVHRISREPFPAEASRVYLAAGVIPTTKILLHSMSLYDRMVRLKDSQYFLIPLALTRSAGDVRREALHTLSQLFMEIFDSQISPHSIHLQVYSYNDLISQAVRKTFGPMAGPLEFLARSLERRLLIVQGYLHSDHSSRIALTLERGSPDRMQLKAEPNPETKPMIRRVIRKLLRHSAHFGVVPILPMLQIADAGRGFHSGCSFPMNANPAAMQSDTLGRPHGWWRVHIADASALPDIPATTITFSAMANAHRIGWLCAGMP
jgi:choline dehydrogenase-like flavoprotein